MPANAKQDAVELLRRLGIEATPDKLAHRVYTPMTRGIQSNLGICSFWCTLFLANEGLRKSEKMTDAEIKRQVLKEFPRHQQPSRTRESLRKLEEGIVTVNYYRSLYNKGRLTRGIVPKHQSRRYGDSGNLVHPKTGKAYDARTTTGVQP